MFMQIIIKRSDPLSEPKRVHLNQIKRFFEAMVEDDNHSDL